MFEKHFKNDIHELNFMTPINGDLWINCGDQNGTQQILIYKTILKKNYVSLI